MKYMKKCPTSVVTGKMQIMTIMQYYCAPIRMAKMKKTREFSASPVVRTRHFHCCGPGSIPGQGIP